MVAVSSAEHLTVVVSLSLGPHSDDYRITSCTQQLISPEEAHLLRLHVTVAWLCGSFSSRIIGPYNTNLKVFLSLAPVQSKSMEVSGAYGVSIKCVAKTIRDCTLIQMLHF